MFQNIYNMYININNKYIYRDTHNWIYRQKDVHMHIYLQNMHLLCINTDTYTETRIIANQKWAICFKHENETGIYLRIWHSFRKHVHFYYNVKVLRCFPFIIIKYYSRIFYFYQYIYSFTFTRTSTLMGKTYHLLCSEIGSPGISMISHKTN